MKAIMEDAMEMPEVPLEVDVQTLPPQPLPGHWIYDRENEKGIA
jgi:hypothetical protein